MSRGLTGAYPPANKEDEILSRINELSEDQQRKIFEQMAAKFNFGQPPMQEV